MITGKTIDGDGIPTPGVSVVVKGTSIGTTSDANGSYSLSVPDGSKTLIFSFIGKKTVEIEIGNQSTIDTKMVDDATQLSEVLITGYSTQNKREVSGSVASVKSESIERVPLGSFDQALQGQVPGLLVQANSGQPGAAATVRIRGTGSLLGNNQPLYILDGIEITANDFSTLNPSDFENLSVLKDAASTSIYGSRSAAGVIVITSKRGKTTTPRINYDVQYGFSEAPISKLKLMNSAEKLDYELANGNPFEWEAEDVEELSKINTDWRDVFFQTGKTMTHTINVSGKQDKTNYFVSGSYFDQSGTVKTTSLKRYTGRINVETGIGNNFSVGINSTFGYSDFTNTSEENTSIEGPV